MRVWILEPIDGSEGLWRGFDVLQRIAVVADGEGEARKVAGSTQPMQPVQKAPGRHDLDPANSRPWENPEASTCREVGEGVGARVLAIQGPEVYVRDARSLA